MGNQYDYRQLREFINANHDRFSELNFDTSMSMQQKMNGLVEWFKEMLKEYNDWIEYLDEFKEKFDSTLYATTDDILNKWLEDGMLTEFIRSLINEEVVQARKSIKGFTYPKLTNRIDKIEAYENEINKKSDKVYVDNMLSSIAKGGPRELFYSLAALKTKYPNGADGTYLVFDSATSDGAHSYMWDVADKIWKDLGVYQAMSLSENQVSAREMQKNVVTIRVAEAESIPDYDVVSKTIDFKSTEGAQPVIIFGNTQIKVPIGTKVTMNSSITSSSLQLIYNVETNLFSIVAWSEVLLATELCVGTFRRDGSKVNFPFTITVNGTIPSPAKTKNEVAIDDRISSLALEDIMVVNSKSLDTFVYEQGVYLSGGGTADSPARIRTKNSVQVVKNSRIEISGDFDMAYVYYDLDGNHIVTGVWTKSFIVPETRLLKLMVRKSSNEGITPSDFPTSNILFNYNGFKNIANNSIPISKIDHRPNKFIHVSFDDVKYTLLDLVNNKTHYNSIFDNPFLSMLKDLNIEYGMVFSLYVYLEEWLGMDNTYQSDFSDNSSWLKIGFHLNEERDNYQFATYEESQNDYKQFVEKAYEVTKNYFCIDRMPRLQNFAFSEVSLSGMRDAPSGVLGMLTADDNRNVTHLGSVNEAYLRKHDRMYDEELNVMYLSTDLRLENSSDVYSSLTNILLSEMSDSLIVFSHEYVFYDSTFSLKATDKLKTVGNFAKEFHFNFDYPQNVFKINEPSINKKRVIKNLFIEFSVGNIKEDGTNETTNSYFRSDYTYFPANKNVVIKVPEGFKLRIFKTSSRNNRDVSYEDVTSGNFKILTDGTSYYRFVVSKENGTIVLGDTENIEFKMS